MPWKPKQHKPPGLDRARNADRRADARSRAHTPQKKARNLRSYRRFSEMIRTQRPTCEDCHREPSVHVHHCRKLADHPEDLLDPEQVRALCHSCHSTRTAKGE